MILHYDDSPEAVAFTGAARAGELAARGMSTPEHILRCGRIPLFVDADLPALAPAQANEAIAGALDQFAARYRETFARSGPRVEMLEPTPRVVLLPGLGLVTAMKDKANAVVGNLCYRHVIRVAEAAEALGGFRFLDEADAIEFEYWPLELAKLKQAERELSRQVALITGAASGIGRAIAERFAAEGAHVVLTDIAGPALRETAAAIGRACKDPQRVVAVEADATRARPDRGRVRPGGARVRRRRHPGVQRRLHPGRPRRSDVGGDLGSPLRSQREGLLPCGARGRARDEAGRTRRRDRASTRRRARSRRPPTTPPTPARRRRSRRWRAIWPPSSARPASA